MIQGKRLLILGGNKLAEDIVKVAKAAGVYTVVMDWYDTDRSPAKLIADEYSMLSLADTQAIVKYIKENKIDGVITGFTDSYLPHYIDICEAANLPCYLRRNDMALTLDKKLFKETCKQYGIDTIPEYNLNQINNPKEFFRNKYPILFKPVDNSGSRGIAVCKCDENYDSCLNSAMENSKKGEVLVEKFMEKDDVSVAYAFRNGNPYLSIVCDRYIEQTPNGGSVTACLIYPSKYTEQYIKKVDEKLKNMFKGLGYKNGVLFLQAFADKDKFYFYEMGYRLSGGRHYISTKSQNNVSALEMLIQFALTGDMGEEIERETPLFKNICGQLSVLCQGDTEIGRIDGFKEVSKMEGVLNCTRSYKACEKIGREGTSAQIAGRVHFVAKDMDNAKAMIKRIQKTLVIEDKQGNNIIKEVFI